MKAFFLIIKLVFFWLFVPLVLGVVFVVAPCYTLGYLGWERVWCGFKGGPPYMGAQFLVGLAGGFVIAFFCTRWMIRVRRSSNIV
jgi:hypothetical protein